ncbi:alpha/beta hydrolase [Kiloniella sp. EL199]|uniref:alpha/beta hydrolase n=1 Tax=Kiloniella sp. EL199 TaxID=2107581 RepID=UPI000EA226B5|nr:alpha/beta hydrolase [Kiloniella sp. EL199]
MKYLFLVTLCLAALTACQTTNKSSKETHGAFYVDGDQVVGGTLNDFELDTTKVFKNRDLSKTTLLIYNHGTISSGIHQRCHTDWLPAYVRLLTKQDSDIIAYYLCSQESGGNSRNSIVNQVHYKRGIEIAEVSDKFQKLGILKNNIFLMGHSGGASSSLMAASRTPEKFNSYIITAPGYGYAYLGGSNQASNYGNLYNNWKTIIQRGTKSRGVVYAFPGDKYSPPEDIAFMQNMRNIDYKILLNKDDTTCELDEIHAYPWTKCFALSETKFILNYIKKSSE